MGHYLAVHLGTNGIRVKCIIGGQNVDFRKYKYQVSLWEDEKIICSGVILDDKHILTAAHCVDDVSTNRIKIVAGVSHIRQNNLKFRSVTKIHLHEDYSDARVSCEHLKNDIAVLTVCKIKLLTNI